MNIFELIQEIGIEPKRKAATNGGEFESPCPFCREGTNRFTVWPNEHNSNGDYRGGRYWCRQCRRFGDAITFLREFHGVTYREACKKLKIEQRELRSIIPMKFAIGKSPIVHEPSKAWQDKAHAFIEWSHTQLMKNPKAQSEIMKRGFTLDSIGWYKLGFNPGSGGKDLFRDRIEWGLDEQLKDDGKLLKLWLPTGFTIPTISPQGDIIKVKIRRSIWQEGDKLPKYVEISGSKRCPSLFGDVSLNVAIILESEFDSLLIQQKAGDMAFCIALGGVTKKPNEDLDRLLKKTPLLLFCLDYDEPGKKAYAFWRSVYPNLKAWPVPETKSPGDAFINGIDLRKWLSEVVQHYKSQNIILLN